MLDVGCGTRPFEPLFLGSAREYVGVDIDADKAGDVIASAEQLPFADGAFDLVLCTQVLEHTADPERVVAELWRVTAASGRLLLSTHGVQAYHPIPRDCWRWTHEGLELLLARNDWASVTVEPAGGTATCLASLASLYLHLLIRRVGLEPLDRPLVWALNGLGGALDRQVASLRDPNRPGTLFLNYHVVANKQGPGATQRLHP